MTQSCCSQRDHSGCLLAHVWTKLAGLGVASVAELWKILKTTTPTLLVSQKRVFSSSPSTGQSKNPEPEWKDSRRDSLFVRRLGERATHTSLGGGKGGWGGDSIFWERRLLYLDLFWLLFRRVAFVIASWIAPAAELLRWVVTESKRRFGEVWRLTQTLKRDCDLRLARSVVPRPPRGNQDGFKEHNLTKSPEFPLFCVVLTGHIWTVTFRHWLSRVIASYKIEVLLLLSFIHRKSLLLSHFYSPPLTPSSLWRTFRNEDALVFIL